MEDEKKLKAKILAKAKELQDLLEECGDDDFVDSILSNLSDAYIDVEDYGCDYEDNDDEEEEEDPYESLDGYSYDDDSYEDDNEDDDF